MAKKCTTTLPSIRLTVHSPAGPTHPHIDKVTHAKANTDWEVWAKVMHQCLAALGYNDDRLVLGFYLDLVNRLPAHLRVAMLKGVAEGYGLQVETTEEKGEVVIQAGLVQRYDSLTKEGQQTTPSGIVLPDGSDAGLLIPPQ